MKKHFLTLSMAGTLSFFAISSCNSGNPEGTEAITADNTEATLTGQSGVKDDESQPNVVGVAVGSKDHTTLVAAVKAAELVDALSNAGPFTVFAPTNDAFNKLPAGTVDDLLKPENKAKLQAILQHHVMLSALDVSYYQDGQVVDMVDGTKATFHVKDGATYIDGAKIIGSVRASNGWVHVVDAVVLPPAK